MKKFPILYQKTKTGAIQFWEIEADSVSAVGRITIRYGQLGTDSPQTTSEMITKGKSLGKKNATTPYEQAEKEAESQWIKQKKAGYVETIAGAAAGEVDALITGGREPMLAHRYMDVIYDLRKGHEGEVEYKITRHAEKIKFPAYAQPKFDGIRSQTEVGGGMWSRTRKPITSMPYIQKQLNTLFPEGFKFPGFIDGELYNHAYKNEFEKIVSAVNNKSDPTGVPEIVELHVYDLACEGTNKERQHMLDQFLKSSTYFIKRVETVVVNSHEELITYFEYCVKRGYEGAMVRNMDGRYIGGRSYDLQKLKPFQDDEFEIVGFKEGRGKMAGLLGTWICKTKEGNTFDPPMNSQNDEDEDKKLTVAERQRKVEENTARLREYFENGNSYIGKLLTVRFQGYTCKNKVPRFPKGHSVRDYE